MRPPLHCYAGRPEIVCELGMKHASCAQHLRSPDSCFPLVGETESQSQPWGRGSGLPYLSWPLGLIGSLLQWLLWWLT